MEFKQTSHQVARGSRPDAEAPDGRLFLFKNVSELRATYQIRLLAYLAVKEGRELVIKVPQGCKVHSSLQELTKQYCSNVTIAKTLART